MVVTNLQDIGSDCRFLMLIPMLSSIPCLVAFLNQWLRPTNGNHRSAELLKELAQVSSRLAEMDCAALRQAVSDLAHGRIATHLVIKSDTLDTTLFKENRPLAEAFNSIVKGLRQTAVEFNTMTEAPCRRLCYVGADSYLEGTVCGEAMGEAIGGRGSVAIISSLGSMSLEMRVAGFQARLRETFPTVDLSRVVYCSASADKICDVVEHETQMLLDTVPDLAGIYLTRGGVPAAAARAVESAGKAGRVKIVCHDMLDQTMQYLEKGVITAALGQDPYGQGHDPVIHLFNHLVSGWQPPSPRLLTRLELATRENCAQYWKAGQRVRVADPARYAAPVSKAPRPLRLAVVGRADNPFFDMVRDGVLAAAEELRDRNATVELTVPEENRRLGKISADVYAPVIESVLEQHYDGIATGIFDPKLVPVVNRVASSGVPVVTYNSEPGGLRSMIHSSIEQAAKLLNLGRTIAEYVAQVSTATLQVNTSMNEVSQGTVEQTAQISHTSESLDSLLKHIAEVDHQAGEGATAAETAAQAAHAGAQAIEKTLSGMEQIHTSVVETSQNVDRLGRNSEKIDGIIKTISTVAYQIKLLGINAAVEAAHAGDYGAGFSIVANEIRSLADRTAKATNDIVEVVKTVQASIGELQQVMTASLQTVKSGSELAGQAGVALGEIRKSVEQNKNRLSSVASSASHMRSFSHQVEEMMEVVATVSERNAAASEEVTASTREMTSRLEELSRMAQNLADIAAGEQQLLARFGESDKA